MNASKNKPSYEELEAEVRYLRGELAELRRLIFAQKRERFIASDESQLVLGLDIQAREELQEMEHIAYDRRKVKKAPTPHARQALPSHLPRKDIIIEPDEDTSGLKKIGEEVTEELEYKPGKFYVNRYIRPKYAQEGDEGVIIAALPSRPIEKGVAGPGLIAHVSISKYVDHLPLYRQRKQFKRAGIDIAESTLGGWVKATYELLLPLYEAHRLKVLASAYLQADETPIRVLDSRKKGKSHRGFFWVYHDRLEGQVLFDYRDSRSRDGPDELLVDFKGFLQCDGYQVYDDYKGRDSIILVGCMAHARRKFVEARGSDRPRAEWMLLRLQELYAIERRARDEALSYQARYELRQSQAAVILDEMKAWLNKNYPLVLPKSAIGQAIAYSLNQWPKLRNYLLDGRLEIDNNLIENAIRPVALGRKNYLFAGSHEGARRAALIYSLVSTAKLHDVEPFEYIKDILSRIPDYPHKQVADLLPANWKKKFKS
jgi:transposase